MCMHVLCVWCVRACVCVCVRVCARACVCVCVRVCVVRLPTTLHTSNSDQSQWLLCCVWCGVVWGKLLVVGSHIPGGMLMIVKKISNMHMHAHMCAHKHTDTLKCRHTNIQTHKHIPYSGKVWRRENLANFTVMSVWRGKVWRMDRFSHKVIIISKNLDGFSLANHG